MIMNSGGTQDGPLMEINTTPLIDVMLVLLIMFIITIPMQTHGIKLDTPQGRHPMQLQARNEIAVTADDKLLWNGTPVNLVALRQYLDQSQMLAPIPELQIRPARDARYELVDKVLAQAKRANVTRMGFVGSEAYAKAF